MVCMPRKIIIEFSLVKESLNKTDNEIKNDILDAISKEILIPWCDKITKIKINKNEG